MTVKRLGEPLTGVLGKIMEFFEGFGKICQSWGSTASTYKAIPPRRGFSEIIFVFSSLVIMARKLFGER